MRQKKSNKIFSLIISSQFWFWWIKLFQISSIKWSLLNYQIECLLLKFCVITAILTHNTVLKISCGLATQFPITVNCFHHRSQSADCFVTSTFLWLCLFAWWFIRGGCFMPVNLCLWLGQAGAEKLCWYLIHWALGLTVGWVNNRLTVTLTNPRWVT